MKHHGFLFGMFVVKNQDRFEIRWFTHAVRNVVFPRVTRHLKHAFALARVGRAREAREIGDQRGTGDTHRKVVGADHGRDDNGNRKGNNAHHLRHGHSRGLPAARDADPPARS